MVDNCAYDEDFLGFSILMRRFKWKKYSCVSKNEKENLCRDFYTSGKSIEDFSRDQFINQRNLKNWMKKHKHGSFLNKI